MDLLSILIPIKEMNKLLCKRFNFQFFSRSKKTSMLNDVARDSHSILCSMCSSNLTVLWSSFVKSHIRQVSWLHFPQFLDHEFGLGLGVFLKDIVEHVNFYCIITHLTFEHYAKTKQKIKLFSLWTDYWSCSLHSLEIVVQDAGCLTDSHSCIPFLDLFLNFGQEKSDEWSALM